MDQIESPQTMLIYKEVDQLVQNLDKQLIDQFSPTFKEQKPSQVKKNQQEIKQSNEITLHALKKKLSQAIKRNEDLQNQLIIKETQLNCLILQNSEYKRALEDLQGKSHLQKSIISEKEKENLEKALKIKKLQQLILQNKSKYAKIKKQSQEQLQLQDNNEMQEEIQKYINFIIYKLKDSPQIQQIFKGRLENISFQQLLQKQDFFQLTNKCIKLIADLIVYVNNFRSLFAFKQSKQKLPTRYANEQEEKSVSQLNENEQNNSLQFSKFTGTEQKSIQDISIQNTLSHSISSQDIKKELISQDTYQRIPIQQQFYKSYQSQKQITKVPFIQQSQQEFQLEKQLQDIEQSNNQDLQQLNNQLLVPQQNKLVRSSSSQIFQEVESKYQNQEAYSQEVQKIQVMQKIFEQQSQSRYQTKRQLIEKYLTSKQLENEKANNLLEEIKQQSERLKMLNNRSSIVQTNQKSMQQSKENDYHIQYQGIENSQSDNIETESFQDTSKAKSKRNTVDCSFKKNQSPSSYLQKQEQIQDFITPKTQKRSSTDQQNMLRRKTTGEFKQNTKNISQNQGKKPNSNFKGINDQKQANNLFMQIQRQQNNNPSDKTDHEHIDLF